MNSPVKNGNTVTLPRLNSKSTFSKGDYNRGMLEVHRGQEKLKVFVEDLNDHVKWLLNRKQFMLQGRHYHVLQQLNETRKALALYEKGIRNLERQIEEDPKIKGMKTHIKFFAEYSTLLASLHEETDQEVNEERAKMAEFKKILAERKKALNAQNHDNIQLASQISRLRSVLEGLPDSDAVNILPIELGQKSVKNTGRVQIVSDKYENEEEQQTPDQQQKHVITSALHIDNENEQNSHTASSGLGPQTENDYYTLKRATESLVKQNNNLKKEIIYRVNNYNEVHELFMEGFHKYQDVLYKSQMVVHNQGLNGSLIFLLLNSKRRTQDNMSPLTVKDNKFFGRKQNHLVKPFQKQQDGEVIDVIYSTFKNMLQQEERKNDKVKEMVSSVQLEQLLNFTPLQIMGLILLKPETLRNIVFEFDDKKRRLIGLSMSLKNVKISTVNK